MYAVYAFARRIDDIADGRAPRDEKLAGLEQARAEVARSTRRPADDPTLIALSDTAGRYPLPREALRDLIDGAAMDVAGTEYATFDDLVVYCRRVGGTIGRLSLGVFGASDKGPEAMALADDLGVAFQLTNILRDVREDLASGTAVPACRRSRRRSAAASRTAGSSAISPGWPASRPHGRRSGTSAASVSCRCSTGRAPRA